MQSSALNVIYTLFRTWMNELNFDSMGYLFPYEIIPSDFNTVFETFNFNTVRTNIFAEFTNLIEELKEIGLLEYEIWIDGSFASLKTNPGDMDLMFFIEHNLYNELEVVLRELRNRFQLLDVYFIKSYPEEHPKFFLTNFDKLDWLHFFTKDRYKNKKGILKINIKI